MNPFVGRFGDRALVDIRTADVQDFIADLPKPHAVHQRGVRVLSPSAVNRIVDLLRHMLNWATSITSTGSEAPWHSPALPVVCCSTSCSGRRREWSSRRHGER